MDVYKSNICVPAANIVNDVLYMINLDGGIIPGDGDGDSTFSLPPGLLNILPWGVD